MLQLPLQLCFLLVGFAHRRELRLQALHPRSRRLSPGLGFFCTRRTGSELSLNALDSLFACLIGATELHLDLFNPEVCLLKVHLRVLNGFAQLLLCCTQSRVGCIGSRRTIWQGCLDPRNLHCMAGGSGSQLHGLPVVLVLVELQLLLLHLQLCLQALQLSTRSRRRLRGGRELGGMLLRHPKLLAHILQFQSQSLNLSGAGGSTLQRMRQALFALRLQLCLQLLDHTVLSLNDPGKLVRVVSKEVTLVGLFVGMKLGLEVGNLCLAFG
mmetsp:Transcript_118345/g.209155  ORF Transcript_118345/g.209155 Transcript_118345/m.209155 type:complete len:269 (-) Transcript_118345:94-900(-)